MAPNALSGKINNSTWINFWISAAHGYYINNAAWIANTQCQSLGAIVYEFY